MARKRKKSELTEKGEASQKAIKPVQWHLATNGLNLLYMLAAGLVMSPKGFREKYYRDTLSSFPGWIPLFADSVPQAAIDLSVREQSHLVPCIATIELKDVHGRIIALDVNGLTREIQFPEELNGSEKVLLVPAPLPATWITSIAFASEESMSKCEAGVRDFENVPLQDFSRKVDALLFSGINNLSWPPINITLPDLDSDLGKIFASGGLMAMLYHMGNLGDIGVQTCRLGFDPINTNASSIPDPMLRELGGWLQTGSVFTADDVLPGLFWGAVDSVVQCHSMSHAMNPIDAILRYFEIEIEKLDDKMKQALSKLSTDLRKLTSYEGSTNTELFEKFRNPFSRAMILFVLREKCSDLLEFQHAMLTELDYICAAILFAVRDGWIGLPLVLRDAVGLQDAVSHRMVAMAHRMTGSGIDLGESPARPKPLRELFVEGDRKKTQKQINAALLLARESQWGSCLNTRITLGKGDYRFVVDAGGLQIILPGEVKAVETEVDFEMFLRQLRSTLISPKIEKKVRDLLNA